MSDAGSIGLSPARQHFLRIAPANAPGVALRADAGGAPGDPASSLRRTQRTFGEALSIAGRSLDQGAANDTAAQARDAAAQFVAQVLVQPLLKQMRSSSWAAAPFAPSRLEQQFRSMMDATVAIDVVREGNWPIVDRLAGDMQRRGRPGATFQTAGAALSPDAPAPWAGTPLADPGVFAAPALTPMR